MGLVVANEATDVFSAGFNLFLVLMAANSEEWGQIGTMVNEFQQATQRMKYANVPVVAAPFGMTLGGGLLRSRSARRPSRAHCELYMGLR